MSLTVQIGLNNVQRYGICPKCGGITYVEHAVYGDYERCLCGLDRPIVQGELKLPYAEKYVEESTMLVYYEMTGSPERVKEVTRKLKDQRHWVRKHNTTGITYARLPPYSENSPPLFAGITFRRVEDKIVLAGVSGLPARDSYTSRCGKYTSEDDIQIYSHQHSCQECSGLPHRRKGGYNGPSQVVKHVAPQIVDFGGFIADIDRKIAAGTDMVERLKKFREVAVSYQKLTVEYTDFKKQYDAIHERIKTI
jgi:hypothetical protein